MATYSSNSTIAKSTSITSNGTIAPGVTTATLFNIPVGKWARGKIVFIDMANTSGVDILANAIRIGHARCQHPSGDSIFNGTEFGIDFFGGSLDISLKNNSGTDTIKYFYSIQIMNNTP